MNVRSSISLMDMPNYLGDASRMDTAHFHNQAFVTWKLLIKLF